MATNKKPETGTIKKDNDAETMGHGSAKAGISGHLEPTYGGPSMTKGNRRVAPKGRRPKY